MLKVEIIFICMNDVCQFNYNVHLTEGTIIPAIMQTCPKCKASFSIQRIHHASSSKSIEPSILENGGDMKETTSIQPNTSPNLRIIDGNHRIRGLAIAQTGHEISTGGREILSGFVNRLTPVFILNNIIQQQGTNSPIDVNTVKEKWLKKSAHLRNALIEIEQTHGVKRGERLSDGFPVDDGPIHIFFNNVIGTAYSTSFSSKGVLERLNFIHWESEKSFMPTKTGSKYNLPGLEDHIISIEPTLIQANPKLLVFLNEFQRLNILDALKEQIPDEFNFLIEILNIISACSQDYGWDSNFYAENIVKDHFNNVFHSRWSNANGTLLFDHFGEQHSRMKNRMKKKGKRMEKLEEFVASRLTNNINSNLGGLLSRMKELNLIYPIRVGRSKNFAITEFGKKLLKQNQEEMDVVN